MRPTRSHRLTGGNEGGALRRRRARALAEEADSPKSDEGRTVPMAARVATELERLFQRSSRQDEDDLVFRIAALRAPAGQACGASLRSS
jgi:hypothetical protein